jgi:hypothetical protein
MPIGTNQICLNSSVTKSESWTIAKSIIGIIWCYVFVSELSEAHAALVLIMGQDWISRLLRLNRNEDILDTFDRRLNEAQQRLMVCQQYFVIDFSFADNDWCPQGRYCHPDRSRPETYRRQTRMPTLLWPFYRPIHFSWQNTLNHRLLLSNVLFWFPTTAPAQCAKRWLFYTDDSRPPSIVRVFSNHWFVHWRIVDCGPWGD